MIPVICRYFNVLHTSIPIGQAAGWTPELVWTWYRVAKSLMYLYDNQQLHIYKYVQSYIIIIIIQQHVSVTSVIIIRVAYNKNTIRIQIAVQKCMTESYDIALQLL